VAQYLEEAEYDAKGYLVAGKLHDYYRVPGTTTRALTKRGGEKAAKLHRWAKGETVLVAHDETPAYTSATVRVTLLDQFRRPCGSAVSSCTTAEAGFRSPNARRKYGAVYRGRGDQAEEVQPPDYRAALNDVVARAGKRAFVQAVIYAAALDEIFTVADEWQEEQAQQGAKVSAAQTGSQAPPAASKPAPAAPTASDPVKREGGYRPPLKGRRVTHLPFGSRMALADMTNDDLAKAADWCRRKGKFGDVVEAIDLELDNRHRAGQG
jgi:hypothetical protein